MSPSESDEIWEQYFSASTERHHHHVYLPAMLAIDRRQVLEDFKRQQSRFMMSGDFHPTRYWVRRMIRARQMANRCKGPRAVRRLKRLRIRWNHSTK